MAIAIRQHTTGDSTSSAQSSLQSSALGSAVLTGSNLKLFVLSGHGGGAPTVTSVTDTASNSGWAKDDSATGNGTQDIEVWTCPNCTGGSSFKVTAHFSGSTNATIWVVEETGEATSSYADGNGSSLSAGTGSATGPSTGSFTTSNAGIIYTFWTTDSNMSGTSPTPPSGYTSLGAVNLLSSEQQGDVAYLITSSGQSGIDPQWGNFQNNTNNWTCIGFGYKAVASASFSASPATVPSNHNGNITLTLTGSGTSWTGGTTFSVSGVTGWAKVSQNVTSGTAATLVVSCPGVASPPTGATGTLTVGDGVLTSNVTVATPTLAVSPTSGNSQATTNLTLTGTNTLWSTDNPNWTTSIAGDAINTDAWSSDTAGTAHYVAGATGGAATVTDPSTGATATFTVNLPQPPSAPTIAISTSGGLDTISVIVASTPGANPIAGYNLYKGSTAQGESNIPIASYTGSGTGSFTAQPIAAPGKTNYYIAKAFDNLPVGTLSNKSNEKMSAISGITPSGVTYKRTFTVGYGISGAGLINIGYRIYDPKGAFLVTHTTIGVIELPDDTGQTGVLGAYSVEVELDTAWSGTLWWDAPDGAAPVYETFSAVASNIVAVNNIAVGGSGTPSDPWRPAS